MAADILFQLQNILSDADFDTIESFIVLYNRFKPEDAGQARVGFEFFIENLQKRYKRKFEDAHEVLGINLEEVEQKLIENESKRKPAIAGVGKEEKLGKNP